MYLDIDIVYHFFESNHGHSICDAAASHVKKGINVFQRDQNEAVRTPQQIVNVAKGIKHHDAVVAPDHPEVELDEFKTFTGIRRQRKFTFTETHAYGYHLSKDAAHEEVYALENEFDGETPIRGDLVKSVQITQEIPSLSPSQTHERSYMKRS